MCVRKSIKGFSLIEILVSLGAFGVFIILVQSVLVMGHSFQFSHTHFMDAIHSTRMIKSIVCQGHNSFKSTGMDLNKTYYLKQGVKNERIYTKLASAFLKPSSAFLFVDIGNMQNAKGIVKSQVAVKIAEELKTGDVTRFLRKRAMEFKAPDFKTPLYYKIYQDSHTVYKLRISKNSLPQSGYLFAARCVKNHPSRLIKGDKNTLPATFDSKAKESSLVYILNQDVRPYYFPTKKKPVKCCKYNEYDTTACAGGVKKSYIPRFYIIHFDIDHSNRNLVLPSMHKAHMKQAFLIKIAHIQEEPEWQNLNTIYGAGFVLTLKENNYHSHQSNSFRLDMMFLKNNCKTSPTRFAFCPDLVFGTDPRTQAVSIYEDNKNLGGASYTMSDLIYPDVSSCSGYSSGVGSSSLIHL